MTTWGTERHFKHFLPRLFELALGDYLSFGFPEVLFGKLQLASWGTWPAVERDAIQTFLIEFWKLQLQLPGDFLRDERIESVLGCLAEACESLTPYLKIWGDTKTHNSALHLARLIDHFADEITTTLQIRLWSENIPQSKEILEWLQAEQPADLLLGFREAVVGVFPLAFSQLEGIRAALLAATDAPG